MPETEAKMVIENIVKQLRIKLEKVVQQQAKIETQPKLPKLKSLTKIRQQVIEQNKEVLPGKELQDEELYFAWGLYIEKLKKQNNNSGMANFRSAILKIADANNI